MEYPRAGVYEHYKSTPASRRYYQVLGTARHTETEQPMVVYVPLYVAPGHSGLRLQVRPLGVFMDEVTPGTARFRFVGDELGETHVSDSR